MTDARTIPPCVIIGFAIKHAPSRHPRSIHNRYERDLAA